MRTRPERTASLLPVALGALLLLAGCTGVPTDPPPAPCPGCLEVGARYTDAQLEQGFTKATHLELSLETPEIRDGGLLLEVVPTGSEPLVGDLELEVPWPGAASEQGEQSQEVCFGAFVGGAGSPFTLTRSGYHAAARLQDVSVSQERYVTEGRTTWSISFLAGDLEPHRPIPVLLAIEDPAWLAEVGGKAVLNVTAKAPFHWRVAGTPAIHCSTVIEDWRGGTYTQALGTTVAEDLHQEVTFERPGLLWFHVFADQGYAARIQGPGGMPFWAVERDRSTDPTTPVPWEDHLWTNLTPGTWTVQIPRLEAAQESTVILTTMELPAWVHQALPAHAYIRPSDG